MSYINSHTLLRRAHAELDAATTVGSPREQFLHAHMAALRGAAAVLAAGVAGPTPRKRKVRSAWEQLAEMDGAWQQWAEYYTASAQTRAALESGQLRDLTEVDAREAVLLAGRFLADIDDFLRGQAAQLHSFAHAS